MGALYPRQTKWLFADLYVFTIGEGDEAMSPSFAAKNVGIDVERLHAPATRQWAQD